MELPLSPDLLRGILAVLSVFSFLVAFGVVEAPQFAAPIVATTNLQLDDPRVGIESAVWSFNPDNNTVHFELTVSNISRYRLTAYVPSPVEFKDGSTKYVLAPFVMSYDFSNLRTAVPMQVASPGQKVYRYEFADCTREVEPNPQDLFTYLFTRYTPQALISGMLGVDLGLLTDSEEFKRVLNESFQNCKSFYATKFPQSRVYLFLGVKSVKRDVVIPIINVPVASYDFPVPDFFAVVEEPRDTWVPRVTGQVYPVGRVRFLFSGEKGQYLADVLINVSDLNAQVVRKDVKTTIGDIYFSFYAFGSGDLFSGKGDPIIFRWTDDYRLIYANDLYSVQRLQESLLNYLQSDLTAGELYLGRLSDVQGVGWKLYTSFQEGLQRTQAVKQSLRERIASYNSSVEQSSQRTVDVGASFENYVLVLPDNPVLSHNMKLRFVGDIRAEYIGLTVIKVTPKITSLRVASQPNGTQPLMVDVSLRDVSGIGGGAELYLTCSRLGSAHEVVYLPEGGRTVTETITLYGTTFTERFTDSCEVTVCDFQQTSCDSREFTVEYVPLQRCDPNVTWCSADLTAVVSCANPYTGETKEVPCGEGYYCAVEEGVAKCVPEEVSPVLQPGEENAPSPTCYCRGNSLVCYDLNLKQFVTTECEAGCVTTPEGAICASQPSPEPEPVKPDVVEVTFKESDLPVRIGFALIGLALAIAVVVI